MKTFNFHLKSGQNVSVATWYDVVSHESAESGECKATGQDWRQLRCHDLVEAAAEIAEFLKNNAIDSCDCYTDVLYGVDADTDYSSGDESYNRCALIVEGTALDAAQIKAFNVLVRRLG